ncbi:MAG: hypothetical protein R3B48_20975 [Kofleriaceae bacterium]
MDLEQLEALAFAPDRGVALGQLLPGSADHDYYRCIHLQHRGQLAEAQRIIDEWTNRHHDSRGEVLALRQLLLKLSGRLHKEDREDARDVFGVHHWHEPEAAPGTSTLPSTLDRHAISGETLLREAVRYSSDLTTVTEEGAYELLEGEYQLDEARRRKLLERLSHTPSAKLVALVASELGQREIVRFGSVAAHRALTIPQLLELAERCPELRFHREWVSMVMQRMRPPAHESIERHGPVRRAYLEELWRFVRTLGSNFVSLRLHVAWHLLDEGRRDRTPGRRLDRELFLEYLQLPRHAEYLRDRWSHHSRDQLGQFGVDFQAMTGLPTVTNDLELVRAYLMAFLSDGSDGADLAAHMERVWFESELATIRLLCGAPDPERWTRVLGPAQAQALLERVEIELGPDNPEELGEDDALTLEVDVKNVEQLFVKVFRIDPVTYFSIHGEEVREDIDLDGLAASHEEVLTFSEPAIRRVRRRVSLPQCARPGCYVIDLIGNGKSSRALVWKGRLRYAQRVSAAGLALTVFDQAGKARPKARAWLGGRELCPDEDGVLTIPFSSAGATPLLLVDGDLATVSEVTPVSESYALHVQAHVEREALSSRRTARAVIHAELTVAGVPVSLALLQQPTWELVLTDRFGTTTQRTSPLVLEDGRCAALEWAMPEDIASVTLHVRGRVEVISRQDTLDLHASVSTKLSSMHEGPHVDSLYLAKAAHGYVLTSRGKSGEPKRRQRVPMWVVHRWALTQGTVTLDTDERGRLELGALDGVESVQANTSGVQHRWELAGRGAGATVQHLEGAPIVLSPPPGVTANELLARGSLVELRAGQPAHHVMSALRVEGRNLVVRDLAPGRYALRLPRMEEWSITVLPAATPKVAGHAATADEVVRLTEEPAAIAAVEVVDEHLKISVRGASAQTRIHVVATHFVSAPAMGALQRARRAGERTRDARTSISYQSGRALGDEYRYVLERRHAPRRPGVMAEKPSLLLNPWARKTTTTHVANLAPDERFGASRPARPAMSQSARGYSEPEATNAMFSTFDFVPGDAVLLANLRPDADGRVEVAVSALAGCCNVQVLCVDEHEISSSSCSLPEATFAPRDLRLRRALPPDAHITQRRQIDACRAGEQITIRDAATAKVHIIDTVQRAHAYLLALGDDDTLREFEFVTRWHRLSDAERGELYSKYACHELTLFLYFRDRPYFDRVLAPYLAQKRVQTFLDRWLLGADLSRYLEPFEFGRLCAVERALLAQRVGEGDAVARLLEDDVALLPPDPERDAKIVEVMLAGAALDDDSPLDVMDEDDGDEPSFFEGGGGAKTESALADFSDITRETMAVASAAPMMMSSPPPPSPRAAPAKSKKRVAQIRSEEADDELDGESEKRSRGGDLRRRQQQAPMFRPADKTQEWAEHNWWRRRPSESTSDMIDPNRLWRDLAAHRGGPFLSGGLGLASGSFAEAMCALAVTDLPFDAEPHRIDSDGASLHIHAASHALVASSQLVEAELTTGLPLIVGQSYLRDDDREHVVDGERAQKFVTGPLVAGVIYACQVVVANPTGNPHRISVLVQIPEGSVPTSASKATRTYDVLLRPYSAHGQEVCFYFPAPGTYTHFGAHVSKRGALIAAAAGTTLEVVEASDAMEVGSWPHLSQRGTLEEVVAYLREANLASLNLELLAWRMREPEAYRAILEVLERRVAFDETLWGYALWHGDRARIRRWLRTQERLLTAGPVLEAALVGLDAEELEVYEHLEFSPLINARAHRLGAKKRILNDGFAKQVVSFLELVAHRPAPTVDDHLVAAHYYYAQDRFEEGRAALERAEAADAAGHRSRMPADYLRAYAACAEGDLATARSLVQRWLDQPVDRWRKRFAALAALLNEAAGESAEVADPRSREQVQGRLAKTQPSFELSVDNQGIELAAQHLDSVELRYFAMDIELLFSRQPFMQGDVARFSYIEPGYREVAQLEGDGRRVPWPASMRGKNVVVEAVGAGIRKAKAHYAHDLLVVTAHQYGQVRVQRASTRAPAVAAYVKVYARRRDGSVAFYKDGYTDVRGWFDYVSLSTDELDHAARFAILVHSDDLGATIVEADPPPR